MAGRRVASIVLALALAVGASDVAQGAEPLDVRYEAFALGFPVVRFDFHVAEGGGDYAVDGRVHTEGVLRLLYGIDLRAESHGTLLAAMVAPRRHEHVLTVRGQDRVAKLDYPGDGRVLAQLVPTEDPGRPQPSAQQILGTLDPLSALLAIGHRAARARRCEGRFEVFDGRRRYDVVLADEGSEPIEDAPAFAGMARRCKVAAVKIAGFSHDQDYAPQTTTARVWLAAPRAGAPALPVRVDFDSVGWGLVEVRMTRVGK
jgi:hypothetical protein